MLSERQKQLRYERVKRYAQRNRDKVRQWGRENYKRNKEKQVNHRRLKKGLA